MKLPYPRAGGFTHRDEVERNRQIELADLQNHKKGQDLQVGDGRLILTDSATGTRYEVGVSYGAIVLRDMDGLELGSDFDIKHAESVVLSTYGDAVSVAAKGKGLRKFGRNAAVGTAFETVAELQGTTSNETFVTTNLIDSISSSSASDTQTIVIEGHTIDGSGNLTFNVQEATLSGQTKVTLTTPIARANRAYIKDSGTFGTIPAAAVGNIYIYDDTGGVTAGTPNTAAATKLMITVGETQSDKCATSISQFDYWFISRFVVGIGNAGGSAARVTCRLEIRDVANGGPWLPQGRDLVLVVGQNGRTLEFNPFIIVPKNHDVRVRARTNANTADVNASLQGYLALIQ